MPRTVLVMNPDSYKLLMGEARAEAEKLLNSFSDTNDMDALKRGLDSLFSSSVIVRIEVEITTFLHPTDK